MSRNILDTLGMGEEVLDGNTLKAVMLATLS